MTRTPSLTDIFGREFLTLAEADALSSRILTHFIMLAESRMSEAEKARAAGYVESGDTAGLVKALRAALPDIDMRVATLFPAV